MKIKFVYTALCLAYYLSSCRQDVAPEVHLLPAGYEGPLIVLYEQPGRPNLPRSGDSIVFDFRQNPIIYTREPLITGLGASNAFQYYYVSANGRRSRINKVEDWQQLQQRPPAKPYLVISAGDVYETGISELVTSARNFSCNAARQQWLADSLLGNGTPLKLPDQLSECY